MLIRKNFENLHENRFEKSCFRFRLQEILCHNSLRALRRALRSGAALANIFVGYYEEKLFSEISKPAVYFRYVDDTFVIFQNEKVRGIFNPDLTVYIPLFSLLLKRRRTTLFLSSTSTLNTRRAATKRKFIANLCSQASI